MKIKIFCRSSLFPSWSRKGLNQHPCIITLVSEGLSSKKEVTFREEHITRKPAATLRTTSISGNRKSLTPGSTSWE